MPKPRREQPVLATSQMNPEAAPQILTGSGSVCFLPRGSHASHTLMPVGSMPGVLTEGEAGLLAGIEGPSRVTVGPTCMWFKQSCQECSCQGPPEKSRVDKFPGPNCSCTKTSANLNRKSKGLAPMLKAQKLPKAKSRNPGLECDVFMLLGTLAPEALAPSSCGSW